MNIEVRQRHKPSSKALPSLSPLKSHNHLLGDRQALDAAWEADGYWFFKGVLDKGAIGRLREVYVRDLVRQGVVDPIADIQTVDSVDYNGGSLAGYDLRIPEVANSKPFDDFVREPEIDAFFTKLLGDEPFWVPVVVYRAYAPEPNPESERVLLVHQDGPNSRGIDFRICWFPLVEIDEDVGGMVIAEGLTDHVDRHPPHVDGRNVGIPKEELAGAVWRHTTVEPGDLVMMNLWTPHSGLSNISGKFRLSVDARVMAKSDNVPLIGRIKELSDSEITVTAQGVDHKLRVTGETLIHAESALRSSLSQYFKPGYEVIVAHRDGLALLVRTPSYD